MIESYIQAGGLFLALDSRGLAVGYAKGIRGQIYPETLRTNPRSSREVNPIVETRIRSRLDRRIERRKEVARISREKC